MRITLICLVLIILLAHYCDAGRRKKQQKKPKNRGQKVCKGVLTPKQIFKKKCTCMDKSSCRRPKTHKKCEKSAKIRKRCPCTCAIPPTTKKNVDRINANDCFNTLHKSCNNRRHKWLARAKCPVICSNAEKRFRICCDAMKLSRECKVFCTYNIIDRLEKLAVRRASCNGEVDKWAHCAAQGSDHRKCCRASGISTAQPAYSVCNKGKLPQACSASSKRALEDSVMDYSNEILECFEENQPAVSDWDPKAKLPQLHDGCDISDGEAEAWASGRK